MMSEALLSNKQHLKIVLLAHNYIIKEITDCVG